MSYTLNSGATYNSTSGNVTIENLKYYSTNGANFYVINTNFNTATQNFIKFSNSVILASGGLPAYIGQPGGHALNIMTNQTVSNVYNYGYLLGGGGSGGGQAYGNGSKVGGAGGAGGGGGGGGNNYNSNDYYAGGSLANLNSNGFSSIGRAGGGGGGPGGTGGTTVNIGGSGSPGAGGNGANGVLSNFYGADGNGIGERENLSAGGGGYGGGKGGLVAVSRNGAGGGGGGGGGLGGTGDYNNNWWTTGGNGGYSIYNSGSITNLYNLQGGLNVYGPLFYGGTTLPTNYYITINSDTSYGQLYCTGWGAIASGSCNIQLDPASTYPFVVNTTTTFRSVLVGNCFSQINGFSNSVINMNTRWSIVPSSPTQVTIGSIPYNSYDIIITTTPVTGNINTSTLYLSGKFYSLTNSNFSSPFVSAYANYSIASGVGFAINSDERIKKNIKYLSSADSFELVKSLKPASFQYIDSMKGTVPKYGYLAQDVESVLPNVVYKNREFIANIFEMVKVEDGNPTKIVLKEKTTESLDIGTKVQFYDTNNNMLQREVVEIVDEKTFIINEPFLEDVDIIFLYGQEVEDYRSIDTDQIDTIMLSTIQEMQTKLEKQQKEMEDLREEIHDLYLYQSKDVSLNILEK